MKKIIAIFLVVFMIMAVSGCSEKPSEPANSQVQNEQETEKPEIQGEEPEKEEPAEKPVEKPADKPAEVPAEKPAEVPADKPEEKPADKPAEKPEEKPAVPASAGNALLSAFKGIASSKSAEEIASALARNEIIPFQAMAMPVEEGFLTGFGNNEIKGFKSGAMFGPTIGAIPFVGYVFELSDGTNAQDFIKTLKACADLRWNICTEAEEMVAGASGNKVFFVMTNKDLNEE